MDAYRAIVTKRDTRKFSPEPIPEPVLTRILQAGRMAGSSKNTQPVRAILVTEPARKEEIASCGQFATHVPACAAAIAVVLTPGGGAFDAGRAAQNMMVAAWAEGVTSCPTSMHDAACANRVLGLPEGHSVAIVLAMGYPEAGTSVNLGRARIPLDDFVHSDHWRGEGAGG
ncbi:MAG: nitroreductase family protein [Chloroflexi bacterium]|nr:nitroreductase family protein [Chloroflexota bacterium]